MEPAPKKFPLVQVLLLAALLVLGMLFVGWRDAGKVTVFLDNGDPDVAVTVKIDGAVAGTVPPGGHVVVEQPAGAHQIVATRPDGKVVGDYSRTLERGALGGRPRRYVLNLGLRRDYHRLELTYTRAGSEGLGGGNADRRLDRTDWYDVTDDDDILEPPPRTIRGKGSTEKRRSFLPFATPAPAPGQPGSGPGPIFIPPPPPPPPLVPAPVPAPPPPAAPAPVAPGFGTTSRLGQPAPPSPRPAAPRPRTPLADADVEPLCQWVEKSIERGPGRAAAGAR